MTGHEVTGARPSTFDGTRFRAAARFGSRIALATAGLAALALALTALPNHVPYPFASEVIAAQWPGDYLWMYPAMLLMLLFVALIASVHEYAQPARKVFSLLGLCFAIVAAAVLLFNPNGVFLALEELGYLLMSIALACLAPVFMRANRIERAIRWLLVSSFVAVIAALGIVSAARGIDRGDRFEVIVISIVWLTLIVVAPLIAVVLRRAAARQPA